MLPSDVDGTKRRLRAPDYFLNFGTNSLRLWKFAVNWTKPSSTTFTGPATIPVASFSTACGGGTCIPQAGTTQRLDSLADRLMYRLAYRKFGTYESHVLVHDRVPEDRRQLQLDHAHRLVQVLGLRGPAADGLHHARRHLEPAAGYAHASGGVPPYVTYAWWRKPACSTPPPHSPAPPAGLALGQARNGSPKMSAGELIRDASGAGASGASVARRPRGARRP